MKKKKGVLFSLIIVFLVAAVLVGGFFLIFSIKTFDIQFSNNLVYLNSQSVTNHINESKGTNAFAFNKDKFISDLESEFPYAKVSHVERVFPSKVMVTIEERLTLYSINYNSKYYIFDNNGRVLAIEDVLEGKGGEYAPIFVGGIRISESDKLSEMIGKTPTLIEGEESLQNVLKFFSIMLRLDYDYSQIKRFLANVEIDIDNNLSFAARYGTKFVIYDFDENSEMKVQLIMGAFTSGVATEPTDTLIISNDLEVKLSKN